MLTGREWESLNRWSKTTLRARPYAYWDLIRRRASGASAEREKTQEKSLLWPIAGTRKSVASPR